MANSDLAAFQPHLADVSYQTIHIVGVCPFSAYAVENLVCLATSPAAYSVNGMTVVGPPHLAVLLSSVSDQSCWALFYS